MKKTHTHVFYKKYMYTLYSGAFAQHDLLVPRLLRNPVLLRPTPFYQQEQVPMIRMPCCICLTVSRPSCWRKSCVGVVDQPYRHRHTPQYLSHISVLKQHLLLQNLQVLVSPAERFLLAASANAHNSRRIHSLRPATSTASHLSHAFKDSSRPPADLVGHGPQTRIRMLRRKFLKAAAATL